MKSPPSVPPWSERIDDVRERRRESIFRTWEYVVRDIDIDTLDCRICYTKVGEAVEYYLRAVGELIASDGIAGAIQHHKAAGLIAASILRYSPIVPKNEVEVLQRSFFDNEVFAICHGLAVCFQEDPDALQRFEAIDGYNEWFKRTMYYMKYRSDRGHDIVAIFDAIATVFIQQGKRIAAD